MLFFVQIFEHDVVTTDVEEHETVITDSQQVQELRLVVEVDERANEIFANQMPAPSVVRVDSTRFERTTSYNVFQQHTVQIMVWRPYCNRTLPSCNRTVL